MGLRCLMSRRLWRLNMGRRKLKSRRCWKRIHSDKGARNLIGGLWRCVCGEWNVGGDARWFSGMCKGR